MVECSARAAPLSCAAVTQQRADHGFTLERRPRTPPSLPARWRWAILIGLVVAAVVGAVSVFLVASHNRAVDRKAVVQYETQVLAPMRDAIVVAGSTADAADAFRQSSVDPVTFVRTMKVYEAALALDVQRLTPVKVPIAFGANERMFLPAAEGFLQAVRTYEGAEHCPSATPCDAVSSGNAQYAAALSRYRHAVNALQDALQRLGYRKSPNFPLDLPR